MQEMRVQSLGWEDPLEEEMATHSSILAWRIPWTEGPDRLQSMGCEELDAPEHNTALLGLQLASQGTSLLLKARPVQSLPCANT